MREARSVRMQQNANYSNVLCQQCLRHTDINKQ